MNFRTDKALIRETNHWCELERASWKPAHSSKKYTPEQRLALAHQYLDKHAFLTVSIYRQLTGLVRSTAPWNCANGHILPAAESIQAASEAIRYT